MAMKKNSFEEQFQKWLYRVVVDEEVYTWRDLKRSRESDEVALGLLKEFVEMEFFYTGLIPFVNQQLDEFSERYGLKS